LKALLGLVFAIYPLAVWLLLDKTSPAAIVAILACLLFLRLAFIRGRPLYMLLGATAIVAFCTLAYLDPELKVLKMYPVLVSLAGLSLCVFTLLNPPSAIERLMDTLGAKVEPYAINYVRTLTGVWAVFFAANASVATYTALAAPIGFWALYNGVISYVLIGLLIVLEYPVRLLYRRRHGLGKSGSGI
jgi:uncharacterized membrane protein